MLLLPDNMADTRKKMASIHREVPPTWAWWWRTTASRAEAHSSGNQIFWACWYGDTYFPTSYMSPPWAILRPCSLHGFLDWPKDFKGRYWAVRPGNRNICGEGKEFSEKMEKIERQDVPRDSLLSQLESQKVLQSSPRRLSLQIFSPTAFWESFSRVDMALKQDPGFRISSRFTQSRIARFRSSPRRAPEKDRFDPN